MSSLPIFQDFSIVSMISNSFSMHVVSVFLFPLWNWVLDTFKCWNICFQFFKYLQFFFKILPYVQFFNLILGASNFPSNFSRYIINVNLISIPIAHPLSMVKVYLWIGTFKAWILVSNFSNIFQFSRIVASGICPNSQLGFQTFKI